MKRQIYFFGELGVEAKQLLGSKGANLSEMTKIGLPIPNGFVVTTDVCREYYKNDKNGMKNLENQIWKNMEKLERKTGKKFGDVKNPLLVSVRSGAAISMPGMMDTILNLGLNDKIVYDLAKKTKNERFAWDSYRRLIQIFSEVVFGINISKFEKILEKYKNGRSDADLSPNELKQVVKEYKKLFEKETGEKFLDDVRKQLLMSIYAVFDSWGNKRAVTYRKLNKIPDDLGTAVNIQEMVFGNLGSDSATGVSFTRNPSTGEKEHYGEYLINAQGEDVVAGVRTPESIDKLKKEFPKAYKDLIKVYDLLEKHYKEMQDFEFTIEKGKLYILQTRTGKRTAQAAIKIAVDMVKEKLIDKKTAIMRIEPNQLKHLLHKRIDPKSKLNIIASGLAASPGAAVGKVVFTPEEAVRLSEEGEKVILIRNETSPEDIHGMAAAQGILTSRGGMTSHAAVVARGMGKCCVSGCESIKVDEKNKKFTADGFEVKDGEWVSLDGSTGKVILGKVETIDPEISGEFREFMQWVDETRKLGVRTNADTPKDAKVARELGAEGIGLCRTEHMFFDKDRLPIVQSMILAKTKNERDNALKKLLPIQKNDFKEIFKVMNGLPVTIRLLDPPLHEFLPNHEDLIIEITKLRANPKNKKILEEKEKMLHRIEELREANPMLGHRGCRLGITFPEIYEMQVKAVFEAAIDLVKEGKKTKPEIMIPLIVHVNELKIMKELVDKIANEIMKKHKRKISYSIGTMIELPRAALTADEIAKYAEFFSFGTNDLTQTTFGFSRDDAEGKFLKEYENLGILPENPFDVLDEDGVGQLIKIAVKKGRKTKPNLKIGICGEHGGEPKSVEFCRKIGLDYVSCSPYRVPIARLAAAQAEIKKS
jgi:pyruvate,orthophosphate dikinase